MLLYLNHAGVVETAAGEVIDQSVIPDNDIGLYVNKPISDSLKFDLLVNPWMPPPTYQMPFSLRMRKGKIGRAFLHHWHLRNGITFSHVQNGLFCRYCVLFSDEVTNRGSVRKFIQLVTVPLRQYRKLTGADGHITNHINTKCHKRCAEVALIFEAKMKDKLNACKRQECPSEDDAEDQWCKMQKLAESVVDETFGDHEPGTSRAVTMLSSEANGNELEAAYALSSLLTFGMEMSPVPTSETAVLPRQTLAETAPEQIYSKELEMELYSNYEQVFSALKESSKGDGTSKEPNAGRKSINNEIHDNAVQLHRSLSVKPNLPFPFCAGVSRGLRNDDANSSLCEHSYSESNESSIDRKRTDTI
ncbi:unnamed protein product [Soboliphyme baturini]|uniref:TTF-type domain-containing protein n=1 Tax=Soboliphyme baturini TaxID=241478 RepID=A0A183IGY1_9BILA|nr:unnamed protein product [Soboliphyme baturini]